MLKRILILLVISCGVTAHSNAHMAEKVPHLRAFLRNINWVMDYVALSVETNACPDPGAINLVANGLVGLAHTGVGTPNRYFSSIELQPTTCDVRYTVNSTIQDQGSSYDLAVPDIVKGGKILLQMVDDTTGIPKWTCLTDIDAGLSQAFQGADAVAVNEPSIISYFSDNLYVGNCVYVASPWV